MECKRESCANAHCSYPGFLVTNFLPRPRVDLRTAIMIQAPIKAATHLQRDQFKGKVNKAPTDDPTLPASQSPIQPQPPPRMRALVRVLVIRPVARPMVTKGPIGSELEWMFCIAKMIAQ